MGDSDKKHIGAYWFVGAFYSGTYDQTERFIEEGIWENGYKDKYLDLVKSIKTGDNIAIKSSYVRKYGLPFDNRGHLVSVMGIKAIGKVKENMGDGRRLNVDWERIQPPREWYFYTHRGTVWHVSPGDWKTDALIDFTFNDKPQDIDSFRNAPYWSERFGDIQTEDTERFQWTRFYEAVADKLLDYKNNRDALVKVVHNIAEKVDCLSNLQDQYANGTTGPLKDICPFTTMGIFNRGITDDNRKIIAGELAKFLEVDEPIPNSFNGLPVLNNQRSWFFNYDKTRQAGEINKLWDVFEAALNLAKSDDNIEAFNKFVEAYDEAIKIKGVAWNLSAGFYWIRPWSFPTLDNNSRLYISKKLDIRIRKSAPKNICNGSEYFDLIQTLETHFQEESYPVHSFPELSLAAWYYKDKDTQTIDVTSPTSDENTDADAEVTESLIMPYTVNNILDDGCFFSEAELNKMLERLRTKKNLVLQGPPGTGKTWLAKRVAFALMGQRDESKMRAVQFHPNLSYEDFVRGWRPAGNGTLSLEDGPFMNIIKVAKDDPSAVYVIIIEEINRGNPAQIFGEMLTLLEADKRTPDEALELCYCKEKGEKVFIPANLYVIGTMNIADRSIALVDLALRRRFAFIDLEPRLDETWLNWVNKKFGIDIEILKEIQKRIKALNKVITEDSNLGRQFQIGHSYVTPPNGIRIINAREWFMQVVETEIGPLLDEYWFAALHNADEAKKRLLENF